MGKASGSSGSSRSRIVVEVAVGGMEVVVVDFVFGSVIVVVTSLLDSRGNNTGASITIVTISVFSIGNGRWRS